MNNKWIALILAAISWLVASQRLLTALDAL
jgi:hypothetical protein